MYARTIARNLMVGELAALGEIPLAYKSRPQMHQLTNREWIGLHLPKGPLGDWLVARADRSKLREQEKSIGALPKRFSGADPFDQWWHTHEGFPGRIADSFRHWDGMGGIVDAKALVELLGQPLPRLFVRLGIATFMTLQAFQETAESLT